MLVFGFHTFMWIINSVLLLHAASFGNNPFHAIAPFLYSLKTSGNQRFSNIFSGYRNGTMAWKGWINIHCSDYYELASYFEQKINFSLKCNFSPLNLQKSCLFRCRSLYTTWSNNYKKTFCKKKKKKIEDHYKPLNFFLKIYLTNAICQSKWKNWKKICLWTSFFLSRKY